MMNEPVTVKIMKMIRKHRSMTRAMNRQPSRSQKKKNEGAGIGKALLLSYQVILLCFTLCFTDVTNIFHSLLNDWRISIDGDGFEIIIQPLDVMFIGSSLVLLMLVFLSLFLFVRLQNRAGDVWFRHEDEWWNDLKEPSFHPCRHVMRIRMSPMDIQGDDRDEDRSIDQNQREEKIHSQQRNGQRRRRD